jgi:hypothetical protein
MKNRKKSFPLLDNHWKNLSLELFVVFLGITAGFLLNNWREQRHEQVLEHKYLERFLQDVRKNIEDLEKSVQIDSIWIEQSNPIINQLKNNTLTQDSAESAMKIILNIAGVDLNTATYEDMINSGNLNLVQDFQLRTQLSSYYISLKKVKVIDDYSFQYFNNFVLPFAISDFQLMDGHFIDAKSAKSIRFANIFLAYYSMIKQKYNIYEEELEQSRLLEKQLAEFFKK